MRQRALRNLGIPNFVRNNITESSIKLILHAKLDCIPFRKKLDIISRVLYSSIENA